MSEVSDLAYIDYKNGMKYKEIADKYKVSINTVKSWKTRYWNAKSVHTNDKKVCTQKKKKGGQPRNKNSTGPPLKNKNSETHGFFSKYLPEDTFNIIQEIQEKDPIDILWGNIQIQYAAIIRAQRLMHVKSQDDHTKILTGETNGDTSSSERYTIQFAWDKQATFLQAQSRAMKTLEGLIKQYDELSKNDLATEEQKLRIDKLKAEVSKLTGGDNREIEDDGFLDALNGRASEVWNNDK